jgi:glycosyltransferase involved in cell wall biosynthesis
MTGRYMPEPDRQERTVRVAMIAYALYALDARVKRAAEALAESGHQVDVFALSHNGTKGSNNGRLIRIRLLPLQRKQTRLARYAFEYCAFFSWAFVLVSILHARRKYNVVYVHNMPNFLVFAGLFPKIGGAKVVLDVHDPTAELLGAIRGCDLPPWVQFLANAEERVSISFSDTLITVNEAMRHRLSSISSRPVSVVMNLPDPQGFVSPETPRASEGLEWIVYSGSIAHRNGLDLVIRAVPLLADEFPSLRFRIIGEGPALESVVRLAGDLGVSDRVEFRGFVSHDQIPSLLSDAAAGVSPQRGGVFGSLVFSMKVAEYVALGLPVICSGIATMRDYFSDDELLFFEPGNAEDLARAIHDLLADPAAAAERAARSRLRLDKLDWPTQKLSLVETVEALAGSQPRHSRRRARVRNPWPARFAGCGPQIRRMQGRRTRR